MVAALAAYPELGCTGGPYEVRQFWGVADDVLCAGNPKTYEFIDNVLDEVTKIFPSPDVYIGGGCVSPVEIIFSLHNLPTLS